MRRQSTSSLPPAPNATGRQRSDWATLKTLFPYLWVYKWRVIAALGGGLQSASVRITLFDGDSSQGQFDFNDNTLLLDSVIRKDFTQLQGLVLFFSVVIIMINIAVDMSYAWFDPRIRYS